VGNLLQAKSIMHRLGVCVVGGVLLVGGLSTAVASAAQAKSKPRHSLVAGIKAKAPRQARPQPSVLEKNKVKRFHANAAFPAVQQAPAISPSTAPRPIYTVDTTSDTNPATPTVACQSGNANTCSIRAAIAAVNKGTGTPIAEIKIPKLTTNYLLSTSLGTLTIRRSVLLDGITSSDSGIKINPDTKSRVLTVEKTILSPTTPRVYIRNLDLTSGKTTKGGDIYIQTADVIMTNDLIESGTAKFGGLIFMTGIGANLWASNTHFLNGYTTGSSTDSGGAITNTGGMAVLVHDTFSKCSAVYGGAIANYGTISDQASGYSTNYAVDGGAIYNTGQLFETTSTFQKNYVTKTTGMVYGGALSNNGHASLQGDSFTQNFAKDSESIEGVTIYNSGSLTGTKVTIGISRAKSATQIWGGAIANDYSTTATISTKGKSRPFMKINGLTVHTTYDQTTSAGYEHSVYGGAIFDAGQAIISTATISHTYVLTSLTATPGSEVVYGGAIDAFAETGPTSTLYPADFTLHGATVRTTVVKTKDGIVAGGAISLGTMNFLLTTATSFKATGETMVIETVLVTTTTVSSGTGKI